MAVSQEARRYGVIRESVVAAIVGSTAATALTLGLLLLRPPGYRAVAEIRFDGPSKAVVDDLTGAALDPATVKALLRKERIDDDPAFRRLPLDRFVDCLGPTSADTACTDSWLGVAAVDDRSLRISVTSGDPDRSAAVANRLASLVIDQRKTAEDVATRAKAREAAEAQERDARLTQEETAARKAAEAEKQRQAQAEREAALRAERDAARRAEAAQRRSDALAALARHDAALAEAKERAGSTRAATGAFRASNPVDATLTARLAAARQAAAASEAEASKAAQTDTRLSALRQQPAATILADSAFSGPAFADLRARYAAASEVERTLSTQLLDRHPTLIDAREQVRSIEREVLATLARLIAEAEASAARVVAADDAARKALAELQAAESQAAASATELARLESIAANAEIAYQALVKTPAPVVPPDETPAPQPEAEPVQPTPAQTMSVTPPPLAAQEKPAIQILTPDPLPPPVETSTGPPPELIAAQAPVRPLGPPPVILLTSAGLLGGALGLLMGGLGAYARRVSRR